MDGEPCSRPPTREVGAAGGPAGWAVESKVRKALQGNETALQMSPALFKLRAPQDLGGSLHMEDTQ